MFYTYNGQQSPTVNPNGDDPIFGDEDEDDDSDYVPNLDSGYVPGSDKKDDDTTKGDDKKTTEKSSASTAGESTKEPAGDSTDDTSEETTEISTETTKWWQTKPTMPDRSDLESFIKPYIPTLPEEDSTGESETVTENTTNKSDTEEPGKSQPRRRDRLRLAQKSRASECRRDKYRQNGLLLKDVRRGRYPDKALRLEIRRAVRSDGFDKDRDKGPFRSHNRRTQLRYSRLYCLYPARGVHLPEAARIYPRKSFESFPFGRLRSLYVYFRRYSDSLRARRRYSDIFCSRRRRVGHFGECALRQRGCARPLGGK